MRLLALFVLAFALAALALEAVLITDVLPQFPVVPTKPALAPEYRAPPGRIPEAPPGELSAPFFSKYRCYTQTADNRDVPCGDYINEALARYGFRCRNEISLVYLTECTIRYESDGHVFALGLPTKYGRAKGLMQLLDETFKDLREVGVGVTDKSIYDPKANIFAGVKYHQRLMKLSGVGCDPEQIAIAYHAGEGNYAGRTNIGVDTLAYGELVASCVENKMEQYRQQVPA